VPGRDPAHWLFRLSPEEWLRAGIRELHNAKASSSRHATRPALASARRAAGMGWNAVLALEESPDPKFGRSYADHLRALADGAALDTSDGTPIPEAVRTAARRLMDDPAAGPQKVVQILTPKRDATLLDAAETVLAEAWSRVVRRGAPGAS
jgi:hypothetical protein